VTYNETLSKINSYVLNKIKTEKVIYKFTDTTNPDQAIHYPVKFLNSLEPSGMPSHKLILKVGPSIINIT
jgi:hypothetical protein